MKRMVLVMGCLSLALVSGCKKESPAASIVTGCPMQGTWVACGNDGTDSQKITLVFGDDGASFSEVLASHPGVLDCSGTAAGSFDFVGFYAFGEAGRSTRIEGATDVRLLPSADILGCGVGNPAYTSLVVATDCQSFFPAEGAPSCDPETSPTTIGSMQFVRQP